MVVDPNSDLRCDLGDTPGVTFVSVAPGVFEFTVQPDCNKNGTADELESPLPDCTRWGFCDADFDEDGFLDGFDFEAFSNLYESGCGWD